MSGRRIIGAKYVGKSETFYVGPKHVPPGAIVTSPPDAVDALCSHPECEVIYEESPGEEGPPAPPEEEP